MSPQSLNERQAGELFSVYQFFADDSYERVRERVEAEPAVLAAKHYCSSVGAQLGTTRRVIITDSSDLCVFEWKYGEGVTFPKSEDIRHYLPKKPQP